MRNTPDQQISLIDPDARSMATSGRGSGVVGYNVQVAVDTEHHLIVTHEVINVGNDRGQLARMSKKAKEVLEVDKLEAVADRGYFDGEEILACEEAGFAVTLPKPITSNAKAQGRFGKQDFAYLPDEDVYRCPSGQLLPYHYTNIPETARFQSRRHADAARDGRASFGTIKAGMGATHFLMKRVRNVAAEMALHVLAYNLTRVMNIVGKPRLIAAIRAA
ncbi:Transposase [Bradyrhizobium sp.]|nr:Transposase [Bradyrhizobium sp.]